MSEKQLLERIIALEQEMAQYRKAEWAVGDMQKSTYDTNGDGIVDNAAQATNATNVNGGTASLTSLTATSGGQITNARGAYTHLGAWGVPRLDNGAFLVNTAYMADVATTVSGITTTDLYSHGSMAYRNVAQAIAANTWTALSFNVSQWASGTAVTWDGATAFSANLAGWYLAYGQVEIGASTTTNPLYNIAVVRSGGLYISTNAWYLPMTAVFTGTVMTPLYMAAGEYVQIMVKHNTSTSQNTSSGLSKCAGALIKL